MLHVAPGPSRGPSAKNLSSLCTLGGSRLAKQAFPPRTPLLPQGIALVVNDVSEANRENEVARGDSIAERSEADNAMPQAEHNVAPDLSGAKE